LRCRGVRDQNRNGEGKKKKKEKQGKSQKDGLEEMEGPCRRGDYIIIVVHLVVMMPRSLVPEGRAWGSN